MVNTYSSAGPATAIDFRDLSQNCSTISGYNYLPGPFAIENNPTDFVGLCFSTFRSKKLIDNQCFTIHATLLSSFLQESRLLIPPGQRVSTMLLAAFTILHTL
jgi:hypothetical protein